MKTKVPWNLVRAVVGAIVALLLVRIVLGRIDLLGELRTAVPGYLVLSVALMATGVILSSYRWLILMRLQGLPVGSRLCFRLTMIGTFWNLVIPGGVGGDVVKAVYIKDLAGPKAAEGMLSIVVDRILGLLGLFMVAILAVLFCIPFLRAANHEIKNIVVSVTCIAAGGATALALAAGHDFVTALPGVSHLVGWLGPRLPRPISAIIVRVVHAMDIYRAQGFSVLLCLAISMLIHSLTALAVWSIGKSFGAAILRMRDYFLATGMANTIAAVPITPGGIGARDVILQHFFEAAGEAHRICSLIPPVFSLVFVLLGLVGGLFYFYQVRHTSIPLNP